MMMAGVNANNNCPNGAGKCSTDGNGWAFVVD